MASDRHGKIDNPSGFLSLTTLGATWFFFSLTTKVSQRMHEFIHSQGQQKIDNALVQRGSFDNPSTLWSEDRLFDKVNKGMHEFIHKVNTSCSFTQGQQKNSQHGKVNKRVVMSMGMFLDNGRTTKSKSAVKKHGKVNKRRHASNKQHY